MKAQAKFSHDNGKVQITIGDNEIQMTLTPDQALEWASKLAGQAFKARGETIAHVLIQGA